VVPGPVGTIWLPETCAEVALSAVTDGIVSTCSLILESRLASENSEVILDTPSPTATASGTASTAVTFQRRSQLPSAQRLLPDLAASRISHSLSKLASYTKRSTKRHQRTFTLAMLARQAVLAENCGWPRNCVYDCPNK